MHKIGVRDSLNWKRRDWRYCPHQREVVVRPQLRKYKLAPDQKIS